MWMIPLHLYVNQKSDYDYYDMMSGYNFKQKYCILLSEDLFTFTNSVDPDEMHQYAAFYLGLHCLQMYSFMGFSNTKG